MNEPNETPLERNHRQTLEEWRARYNEEMQNDKRLTPQQVKDEQARAHKARIEGIELMMEETMAKLPWPWWAWVMVVLVTSAVLGCLFWGAVYFFTNCL